MLACLARVMCDSPHNICQLVSLCGVVCMEQLRLSLHQIHAVLRRKRKIALNISLC